MTDLHTSRSREARVEVQQRVQFLQLSWLGALVATPENSDWFRCPECVISLEKDCTHDNASKWTYWRQLSDDMLRKVDSAILDRAIHKEEEDSDSDSDSDNSVDSDEKEEKFTPRTAADSQQTESWIEALADTHPRLHYYFSNAHDSRGRRCLNCYIRGQAAKCDHRGEMAGWMTASKKMLNRAERAAQLRRKDPVVAAPVKRERIRKVKTRTKTTVKTESNTGQANVVPIRVDQLHDDLKLVCGSTFYCLPCLNHVDGGSPDWFARHVGLHRVLSSARDALRGIDPTRYRAAMYGTVLEYMKHSSLGKLKDAKEGELLSQLSTLAHESVQALDSGLVNTIEQYDVSSAERTVLSFLLTYTHKYVAYVKPPAVVQDTDYDGPIVELLDVFRRAAAGAKRSRDVMMGGVAEAVV